MHYPHIAIADDRIPRAAAPLLQHVLDTYASETNKVAAIWRAFADADLGFRPHPRSTTVEGILKHQLLSERRFFGEFLGAPEPAAAEVVPAPLTADAAVRRLCDLALPRLGFLAAQPEPWWLARVAFFDVERERIWIVWRRILHTAHHRTQLAVYLRLLDKPVPPTYGPTADATWSGADPTTTVDAAARR
jgi:uncharacterized damage-inducible protein DinB